MASSALVTVGIPVRNGARFIADAIRSVQAQTTDDWRLVVGDNASTDDTAAIVAAAAARDPRISLLRHALNLGVNANFNAVLHLATTPYVKWLAADDRMGPTFLADAIAALDQRDECVGVAPVARLIDADGRDRSVDRALDQDYDASSPVERVRRLLVDDAFVFVLFGLWRREVVAASRGLGQYIGADKVLLTELLAAGNVLSSAGAVHESRCHPDQSLHMSLDIARGWVLGRAGSGRWAPAVDRIQTFGGYLGAIARADVGPSDRLALFGVFARFMADREGFRRRERDRNLLREVPSTPPVREALG